MLTAQYLMYAKKVWQGLSELETKEIKWLLPRKKISYQQLLDSLSGNTFLNNEPQCKQYHLLKSYLKKYKAIKLKNNLPIISTDKKRFKLNDSSKTIVQLKQWFYLMGDLKENNQSIFFDEPLQAAVKNA